MRNVEIKAKVKVLHKIIEKAKQLSTSPGIDILQHDTFFNVEQGRLKLRKFEDGSAELIFYERPDVEGPKTSLYEKSSIPAANVSDFQKVLTKALGVKCIVEKKRELYQVDQTRVHIDAVKGLGDFMELEVQLKPEQTAEEGEKIAFELMEKLGVEKDDLVAGAYADLLMSQSQ